MSDKCFKENFHGSCCCNCKWQFVDRSHPGTDGLSTSHTRGYICAEPYLGYHSDWFEHGMCECWQKRPERPDPPMNDPKNDLWFQLEAWDAKYTKRDNMLIWWKLSKI